ncbi:MAG TPA: hypothetical protein VFC56_13510 [Stellaceae bacterium]|nr:hypothetical protein [Stellaceae bacterium]
MTYELWHERYDGREDHDKLLGVYSTREKAEEAPALLRGKPGFRDHPDGFDIRPGGMDGLPGPMAVLSPLIGAKTPRRRRLPRTRK